jgi:hypothetical protein
MLLSERGLAGKQEHSSVVPNLCRAVSNVTARTSEVLLRASMGTERMGVQSSELRKQEFSFVFFSSYQSAERIPVERRADQGIPRDAHEPP